MDLARILAELHKERDAIDEAIHDLERLAGRQRRPLSVSTKSTAVAQNGSFGNMPPEEGS